MRCKAAVNRFLLLFCTSPLVAKPAFLIAELHDSGYSVLAERGIHQMAPVGSLLKPFATWYLLEQGVDRRTVVFCPPEKKREENLRCWTPQGHGEVDFAAALIHSCNYFYLSLFSGRRLADYENWLRQRFDWPARLAIRKAVNVYGFDLAGGIEPERLLRMYLELMHAAGTPNSPAAHILQALAGICRGTLADFCRALDKTPQFHLLWGKTGTVQSGSKPYGIVLVHLEHRPSQRKILLLCYEKNKTGSQVALRVPALLAEYERKSGKKGLAR